MTRNFIKLSLILTQKCTNYVLSSSFPGMGVRAQTFTSVLRIVHLLSARAAVGIQMPWATKFVPLTLLNIFYSMYGFFGSFVSYEEWLLKTKYKMTFYKMIFSHS